jgi:hypothetical protein
MDKIQEVTVCIRELEEKNNMKYANVFDKVGVISRA